MKLPLHILAAIPISGALFLYGSAFFGIWTAPGLEALPTYGAKLKAPSASPEQQRAAQMGIAEVSKSLHYRPDGVSLVGESGPVARLPKPRLKQLLAPVADETTEPVDIKDLPPRWYTTNPPPPEPEPEGIASTNGYSSNSRATQTSTSGGRASSGSSRARNYSTSRQRSSRVR